MINCIFQFYFLFFPPFFSATKHYYDSPKTCPFSENDILWRIARHYYDDLQKVMNLSFPKKGKKNIFRNFLSNQTKGSEKKPQRLEKRRRQEKERTDRDQEWEEEKWRDRRRLEPWEARGPGTRSFAKMVGDLTPMAASLCRRSLSEPQKPMKKMKRLSFERGRCAAPEEPRLTNRSELRRLTPVWWLRRFCQWLVWYFDPRPCPVYRKLFIQSNAYAWSYAEVEALYWGALRSSVWTKSQSK